jgi:hypothetical protein
MPFNHLPNNSGLAINNPNLVMNGHGPRIVSAMYDWLSAGRQAMQDVDILTHKMALTFGMELAHVSWLASEDTIEESRRVAAKTVEAIMERDRQRALGTLALSDLYLILCSKEDGLIRRPVDSAGSPVVDVLVDMTGENDMPLPHRLHVPTEIADELLNGQLEDEESWHRNEHGLYVKRTALDMTAGMEQIITLEGQSLNRAQTQTLFPYLPAPA